MSYDAIVVGGGPNGLCAAITLAAAGRSVLLREAHPQVGGGCRSAPLTLEGYVHDVCSAIHPFALASPFLRTLPLARHGLRWVHPGAPLAHPLDGGLAAILEDDLEATARGLGDDGPAWRGLFGPLRDHWQALADDILGFRVPPRAPLTLLAFGRKAIRSASGLAGGTFVTPQARALFAGIAAHSFRPLHRAFTASFGLLLGVSAQAGGWPFPEGGAGRLAEALASHLRELGGEIQTGAPVSHLSELPPARDVLLDLTPRQVLSVAGDRLSGLYARRLGRYRYGPAAFKVDWALSDPIPWTNKACARAGTLHLGGVLEELAEAEAAPWAGRVAARPFVLLAQHTLFDSTRAPAGRHTAWAYCHVPMGSTLDVSQSIEDQVERFAPGFRDTILARSVRGPRALEAYNPNLVGGDIAGGAVDLRQLLLRPVARVPPWSTPVKGLWICSASTPPGPGVHGMCGHLAARAVLAARP